VVEGAVSWTEGVRLPVLDGFEGADAKVAILRNGPVRGDRSMPCGLHLWMLLPLPCSGIVCRRTGGKEASEFCGQRLTR